MEPLLYAGTMPSYAYMYALIIQQYGYYLLGIVVITLAPNALRRSVAAMSLLVSFMVTTFP
jgi:hypothetical protein